MSAETCIRSQCPEMPKVTLDQAVIDLMESIALQETALSHILCAESQKMKVAMGLDGLDLCKLLGCKRPDTVHNLYFKRFPVVHEKDVIAIPTTCGTGSECTNISVAIVKDEKVGVLSGGERNRLNLALTLKQGGNLLLLAEPTTALDVATLSSLEAALLEFPGCSVVISHDRMFLDRVATHILAWEGTDENPGNWYWFEGNFEAYQANRIERLGEDAAQPHRNHRTLPRD